MDAPVDEVEIRYVAARRVFMGALIADPEVERAWRCGAGWWATWSEALVRGDREAATDRYLGALRRLGRMDGFEAAVDLERWRAVQSARAE